MKFMYRFETCHIDIERKHNGLSIIQIIFTGNIPSESESRPQFDEAWYLLKQVQREGWLERAIAELEDNGYAGNEDVLKLRMGDDETSL